MKRIMKRLSIVLVVLSCFTLQLNVVMAMERNHSEELCETVSETTDQVVMPRYVGYATVIGNGVRIRSSASTSGTIVGLAYKDDRVFVQSSDGSWCKIKMVSNGVVGYVSRQYLLFD